MNEERISDAVLRFLIGCPADAGKGLTIPASILRGMARELLAYRAEGTLEEFKEAKKLGTFAQVSGWRDAEARAPCEHGEDLWLAEVDECGTCPPCTARKSQGR